MHDPIALAAELKRTKQHLRDTEDDLAQTREQLTAALLRIQALQVHEAIVRIPAQPPDPDGGLCDPTLMPVRKVRDAGSIDTWQEQPHA